MHKGVHGGKESYVCIYYPRCRGNKHVADHVIPTDKKTRTVRYYLHKQLSRVFGSRRRREQYVWLSVFAQMPHVGQMTFGQVIDTQQRLSQWEKDDVRRLIWKEMIDVLL